MLETIGGPVLNDKVQVYGTAVNVSAYGSTGVKFPEFSQVIPISEPAINKIPMGSFNKGYSKLKIEIKDRKTGFKLWADIRELKFR